MERLELNEVGDLGDQPNGKTYMCDVTNGSLICFGDCLKTLHRSFIFANVLNDATLCEMFSV